jgi:hypothetical protein
MRRALFVLAMLTPATLFAADGDPTLKNSDSKRYDYRVECKDKATSSYLGSSTTTQLENAVGCTLKVTGAGTAKLKKGSACTIKDAKLSCT